MASTCSRLANRASFSSIKSAIRSNVARSSPLNHKPSNSTSSSFQIPSSSSTSPPLRGFSSSRSFAELGCVQSLLPLHSVVAAARMTSCLSTSSKSCRALSQELGLSVPR